MATPALGEGVRHRVEVGQTLWRIARVYGVPVDELARANGIEDASDLEAGRILFVPGARRSLEVPPYPAELPGTGFAPPPATGDSFDWPVAGGRVLSYFGAKRGGHRHSGLDIGGRPGQPVSVARDGRVVYTGSTMRGYGKTVIVDHGDGFKTLYAHGSALLVREGEWVRRGQRIARIGRSGNATTEHCHFEIRRDDVPVDPLSYLVVEEGRTR